MVTDPPITRRRAMLAGITGLTGMSALSGCIENPNEPRLPNSDPDNPDGDREKDDDRYDHENDAPAWFERLNRASVSDSGREVIRHY